MSISWLLFWIKSLLPRWPVVPPRLWLTVAVAGILALNIGFAKEIWRHTPAANVVLLELLLAVVVVAIPQVIQVLWQWQAVYSGPWWARLLFTAIVLAVGSMLGMIGVVLVVVLLVLPFYGYPGF